MGPSTSWGPWPRPVTREAWGTQECTQIGKNGLSGLFWGICVHCRDSRGPCEWPWERRSVHRLAKMASRSCFGSFVYTVATREGHARGRGDAGVYTDWRKWPLGAGLGHLCTLLRLARAARVAPPLGWRLCRDSNPHKPRGARYRNWASIGTHRRKVRSLSARRAPLVRREMRQAH